MSENTGTRDQTHFPAPSDQPHRYLRLTTSPSRSEKQHRDLNRQLELAIVRCESVETMNQHLKQRKAELRQENQYLKQRDAELLEKNQHLKQRETELLEENQHLKQREAKLFQENKALRAVVPKIVESREEKMMDDVLPIELAVLVLVVVAVGHLLYLAMGYLLSVLPQPLTVMGFKTK